MTADVATATGRTAPGRREKAAHLLSELFAPWVCAAVLPPVVGAVSDTPWWRGLLLGLMTAVFSAGIPYLLILHGVRRGALTDRHVSRRKDRPMFLGITVALVLLSLVLARLLGGPPELTALIAAMMACAAIGALVSLRWKLSMHTVVLAGSMAALFVVLGPWVGVLLVLVLAVAWARVVLRSHTSAQVAVGAVVGAVTAGLIMTVSSA